MKRIGLIQIDGTMPNLALLKLSKFYKNKGYDVVFIDLSMFNIKEWIASKIFVGGSGYNLKEKLPIGIETLIPDYEKFNMDYSLGFSTRGCIRDCEFCIVKEKEGKIKDVSMNWIRHSKVILFDNNILASPLLLEKMNYFIENNIKVCFNQGLDFRLLDESICNILSKVKYYDKNFNMRKIYFAFDDLKYKDLFKEKMILLKKYIIPSSRVMVYILTGFNSTFEEDMERFKIVWSMGFDPYIMLFNDRRDKKKLRKFERWVNRRLYKVCKFKDYKGGVRYKTKLS